VSFGHRTWCGLIYNFQVNPWNVYDPQSQQVRGIPGKLAASELPTSRSFFCDYDFGWCSNTNEVRTRAYRFRKGSTVTNSEGGGLVTFFLFLDYNTAQIMFVRGAGGSYDFRQGTGVDHVQCVNVILTSADDDPRIDVIVVGPQ
jgi:hypothetical protein